MIEGRYNLGSVAEMESFADVTSLIFRRLEKFPGSLGLLIISCEMRNGGSWPSGVSRRARGPGGFIQDTKFSPLSRP